MHEEHEKKLNKWLYKYSELTGKKISKTEVLNMLLEALLDTDNIDKEIKEMQ